MAEAFSINPLTDWFEVHGNHFCDSVHGLYRYNGHNYLWLYPSVHDWRTWQSFAATARNLGQHQNEEALRAAAEADNVHRLSKYVSATAQNAEQAAEIERLKADNRNLDADYGKLFQQYNELNARAEAAEARCAELEKALEPFAERAAAWSILSDLPDKVKVEISGMVPARNEWFEASPLTLGDFRKARAALGAKP